MVTRRSGNVHSSEDGQHLWGGGAGGQRPEVNRIVARSGPHDPCRLAARRSI